MEETYFYCQACNTKITVEQLGLLNEGKCSKCNSLEGFSTIPKGSHDSFENVTMVNESEMLKKVLE